MLLAHHCVYIISLIFIWALWGLRGFPHSINYEPGANRINCLTQSLKLRTRLRGFKTFSLYHDAYPPLPPGFKIIDGMNSNFRIWQALLWKTTTVPFHCLMTQPKPLNVDGSWVPKSHTMSLPEVARDFQTGRVTGRDQSWAKSQSPESQKRGIGRSCQMRGTRKQIGGQKSVFIKPETRRRKRTKRRVCL